MKIVYNNIIPFKGFKCINLFGVLFVRKGCEVDEVTLNHEKIHTVQMKEMLYIPFYMWYLVEWLVKLCAVGSRAYKSIGFEQEAYAHQYDPNYVENRHLVTGWLNKVLSVL